MDPLSVRLDSVSPGSPGEDDVALAGAGPGSSALVASQMAIEERFNSMEATFRDGQASADARASRDRAALQAELGDANCRVAAMDVASHSPEDSASGDTFHTMQDQAELCEQPLATAGFAEACKPRYLDVVLAARTDVIHAAASRGRKEGEVYENRSKYCVAEPPIGLAPYPPAVFTASDQQYTKPWRCSVLSIRDHGAVVEVPPSHSLKEGESLYTVLLWMEISLISLRLACRSMGSCPSREFDNLGLEYLQGTRPSWYWRPRSTNFVDGQRSMDHQVYVSYEAWRMRIDGITMVSINPEAASLYARDQRIERVSSLILPTAQRHVGLYNQQTSVQISKLVAGREAAMQLGLALSQATGLQTGSRPDLTRRPNSRPRWRRRPGRLKRLS
jgi:hypothetical protein